MARSTASARESSGCAPGLFAAVFFALLGLVALLIPFGFIAMGVHDVLAQDRDMRAARPVPATVVSSRVGESRGRRGRRSDVAVVVYRYDVGGRQYTSDVLMPYAARGLPDGVRPREFVAARPPGAAVDAWYLPHDPSRAFLVKAYNEAPYIWIYIGLAFLALFQAGGLGYAFHAAVPALPPEPGWRPLPVRRPLRARVTVNLVQSAVYLSVWGWAAWHYFSRVPGPHGVAAHGVTWAMGLPGLWYLFSAARAYFTRRAVSDARVSLRAEGFRVGREAEVKVEQDLLGDAMLQRVRVGLVCYKTTGRGKSRHTAEHWQAWVTPEAPAAETHPRGRGARKVTFTQTLLIPVDQPASDSTTDPRYAWKLVVETALAGCPDYRESFDVIVLRAGDEE
jgi:hypothetical protein